MINAARYFDNAATTPLDPRVLQAISGALAEDFGNPNSIHQWGRSARAKVEAARETIASVLGAEDPFQITFTSGATESNNWVLRGFERIAISPFEHSSVQETAKVLGGEMLANEGWQLLSHATSPQLLSVIRVNNETGAIVDFPTSVDDVIRHSDLTQAIGKQPVTLTDYDLATWSGHKFYGPKGVGALFAKDLPPAALLTGGEQEHGFRSGTLNAPAIIGMAEAATIAIDELSDSINHAQHLRSLLLDELTDLSDWRVIEAPQNSPFILALSFLDVLAEPLVVSVDADGFAISSGAACSTQSTEPSWVLLALGMELEWIRATIRISFGKFNTEESTRELARSLRKAVQILRRI